ncbi:MAG: Uncharacterised protein [SAR116 cluster bacterium]|nr:MAG: Uncharacterised protein [SAR116 cluster bacterium]
MIETLNQNIDNISYGVAILILFSPLLLKEKFG